MDKKEPMPSSDDEHFEDANEKVINDIIDSTSRLSNCESDEENYCDQDGGENFQDCETNDLIDDESQRDFEKDQTEEEREEARLLAVELKDKGNEEFRNGNFEKSAEIYTNALRKCPVFCASERSMLYGNRSLAKAKLGLKPAAIDDCSKSIEFNPKYVKVLLRFVTHTRPYMTHF
jgi:tetratricopeptide (TPR) repeat protein